AEMPVSFAAEALSAQAVAARSYLLSHSADYGRPRHAEADVCAESAHCQAYLSEAELRQRWGAEYEARYAKIAAAVAQTRGLVLWYEGAIAEAPFCSACGGSSEAAAELWGGVRDYLIAAECRWCVHAPRYRQTEVLPLSEAAAALSCTEAELLTMQLVAESSGGRVADVRIGGSSISGAELRQRLKLPSAAFSWLIAGDELRLFCRGYGHGVGLCQYGADGMAAEGAHFTAILAHYYPGTQLMQLY
ncbi:MAG: stage II sporulation protein D, partial [Firmicutes bacterium]|nr:stage II sporulation protein D [Bacillota bacterium]